VSNVNPYSESLFKTLKYGPEFPERFGSLSEARQFMDTFTNWYNHEHRHTGYRDCWFLSVDRAANQTAFLTKVGVHGERGIEAKEVLAETAGRVRRPGTDTISTEVWNRVKTIMKERNWSEKDFALATDTRFDGPRMWTHAPGCTV
jgi:hypothetical protein